MTTSDKGRREEPSIWERYGIVSQIALAAASLLTLVLVLTDSIGGAIRTQVLAIVLIAALYVGSGVFFVQVLRRTGYYRFRIALTGGPGAGKTVFSLLLYDYLMNTRSRVAEFTADSKSAIATYQAIRDIAVKEWPPTTTRGSVIQYDGTVRFRRRTVVDLQIGDSAGEHWLNLASRQNEESDYISWVLSAQGIVHVISVETLVGAAIDSLSRDVDDLKLAAHLMRGTRAPNASLAPLLVVISKMDLIDVRAGEDLMVLYPRDRLSACPLIGIINGEARQDVGSVLADFGKALEGNYRSVHYVFASIELATNPARLGLVPSEDTLAWIVNSATRVGRGNRRSYGPS